MFKMSSSLPQAFPPPEAGQHRFVIHMPPLKDDAEEDMMKVQIIVGKTVEVDSVNHHMFGGKLEQMNIQGWGFTRLVLKELGPLSGTLMALVEEEPKVGATTHHVVTHVPSTGCCCIVSFVLIRRCLNSSKYGASQSSIDTTANCLTWYTCPKGSRSGTVSGERMMNR